MRVEIVSWLSKFWQSTWCLPDRLSSYFSYTGTVIFWLVWRACFIYFMIIHIQEPHYPELSVLPGALGVVIWLDKHTNSWLRVTRLRISRIVAYLERSLQFEKRIYSLTVYSHGVIISANFFCVNLPAFGLLKFELRGNSNFFGLLSSELRGVDSIVYFRSSSHHGSLLATNGLVLVLAASRATSVRLPTYRTFCPGPVLYICWSWMSRM